MNFKRTLAASAVSIALGFTASTALASSDNSKGFLTGIAETNTGSVASGITVTIKNKATGLTRSVTTGTSGAYQFPLLPPGSYTVTTSGDGYVPFSQDVDVNIGDKTIANVQVNRAGETITVTGGLISTLDTGATEQSYVFSSEDIERMPVPRNVTGVAMLAPGVVQGDAGFGNLASFGGSSVGENIYLVNGLNITSHRDGLALSTVPFEFYDTFNVKTGGWSAEFGRSLGGAMIATTKSGTNNFEFGASAYLRADDMSAHGKDVVRNDSDALWINQSNDTSSTTNLNIWAGGALIEDKLFVFGLLNPRITKSENIANTSYATTDRTDMFYGLKVDYYLSDDHIVEFTAFGDDRNYDVNTGNLSNGLQSPVGQYVREVGGNNYSLQYTGVITDDVTVSAMYGVNNFDNSSFVSGEYDERACAFDRFTGENYSGYVLCTNVLQQDEREQFRVDVDWYLGDHSLRFGLDMQNLTAFENTGRSGGNGYNGEYYTGNKPLPAGAGVVYRYQAGAVRVGHYENTGGFETKDNAIYVEDTWQVTDSLTLKLGMRNDTFENFNVSGDAFIDIGDQWAPRLGIAWDPTGEEAGKAFASFGRYYLGVATNTNVRLAGSELFTRQYFTTDGPDANGNPTGVVVPAGNLTVYGDGEQRSNAETVDANIKPMYEDELIVGYQHEFDLWNVGIKWTARELGESIEDIAIDAGFSRFLADQGETCDNCYGFHYYVLTNPGSGTTTITTDPNGTGDPANVATYNIPNSYLGYPKAERKYRAWDLELTHPWDGEFALTVNYTWSHSWGNNEGWVRSDNQQTDAGLTTNFDQPGLADHAYGDLPNDRTHQVKVFGAYALTDDLNLGFNFAYQTGRPINAFGVHPSDDFASLYGAASFYRTVSTYDVDPEGYSQAVPRGSLGRTPETWKLDLNLTYNMELFGGETTLRLDVFNVLNNDEVTAIYEVADRVSGNYRFDGDFGFAYTGEPEPNYGLPRGFQNPRYVRLSATWAY